MYRRKQTQKDRQKDTKRQIESGRHTKNSYVGVGPHKYSIETQALPQADTHSHTHTRRHTHRKRYTHRHTHSVTQRDTKTHRHRKKDSPIKTESHPPTQPHTGPLTETDTHKQSYSPKKVPTLVTKALIYTKCSHAASKHWHILDKEYWHFTRRNTYRDRVDSLSVCISSKLLLVLICYALTQRTPFFQKNITQSWAWIILNFELKLENLKTNRPYPRICASNDQICSNVSLEILIIISRIMSPEI